MSAGDDWLLRPVVAGCCRFESLVDGTLSLGDIAVMNEALDVRDENERRYYAAREREHGR